MSDPSQQSTRSFGKKRAILVGLLAACSLVFGVASASAYSTGLSWSPSFTENPEDFAAMSRLGATTLRLEINMGHVANFGWGNYDKTFEVAAAHGIVVFPYLDGNTLGQNPRPTEAEEPAYETFVYEAVHRYGYGGSHTYGDPAVAWEIGNEPNYPPNNPGGFAEPQGYGHFLKRMSAAVRAAQKQNIPGQTTEIVFGGMAWFGSGYMSPEEFFEKALPKAELASFNGVGIHPYAFGGTGPAGVISHVKSMRKTMNSKGAASKEVWITELGWPVAEGVSGFPTVTEQQQGEYLWQAFAEIRKLAVPEGIHATFWYFYRDNGQSGWQYHTGLRDLAGAYRPAWYAFQGDAGHEPWPFVFAEDNLQGESTAHPAISHWGPNRLDVFVRGIATHQLWHKYFEGAWGPAWENVGGPELVHGPGAASWSSGRLDVVAEVAGGTMGHWYWLPSVGWSYDNLGGAPASDAALASWEVGRLDAFATNSSGQLIHDYWYNAAGQWSGWEALGGGLISGPAAVSWGPGRIDIVAVAANHTLEHWFWDNSFGWAHDNLGGNLEAKTPGIASWKSGRLDVFANSASGELVHDWFTPTTGWSGFEGTGKTGGAGPSATSWGLNRLDVVTNPAAGGAVAHNYFYDGY